jgi:uncharacterized protein (TIGR02599 family)
MKTSPHFFPRRQGFSLIELMVATAVLSLMLVIVFQMLKGTQRTWRTTRQDVTEFKDARQSFEELTRRVSQATLNTYYSYRYDTVQIKGLNLRMGREFIPQSELHFVCGPAEDLGLQQGKTTRQVGQRYTHGIFFQAPFGFCVEKDLKENDKLRYEKMNGLLNGWGYFIEFNTDELDRPQFFTALNNSPKPRPRYRLMEFRQPTEYLTIYKINLRDKENAGRNEIYEWFNTGNYSVNSEWNTTVEGRGDEAFFRTTRVVAENICAMILHPREADEKREESADELAPNYVFDSRQFQWGSGDLADRTRHQLPPVIDVTFIALDEGTFNTHCAREGIKTADDDPKLIDKDFFKTARDFRKDLEKVEENLKKKKLDYRVFNTSIRIRESKWVDKEKNS